MLNIVVAVDAPVTHTALHAFHDVFAARLLVVRLGHEEPCVGGTVNGSVSVCAYLVWYVCSPESSVLSHERERLWGTLSRVLLGLTTDNRWLR